MSIHSTEYKYYKYTTNNVSVNHPSFDRDLDSSFSSFESRHVPSRTKSSTPSKVYKNWGIFFFYLFLNTLVVRNKYAESSKAKSFISEPVLKKSSIPLTQEALAMHNSFISSQEPFEFDPTRTEEQELEQSLLDKVEEQCKTMKQEFEEKISVRSKKD